MEPQQTTAVKKAVVEYKPLGGDVAIRLTPGIVTRNLCVPTRSGALPSESDVINFMMLCKSRALNPFEGDAFLIGYDSKDGPKFSLITGIQAFLKRAESCKEYDGHRAGVIIADGPEVMEIEGTLIPPKAQVLGGWAAVYRSDRKMPFKVTVELATYHSNRSRWNIDPKGMIRKVALSQALREAFPTRLGGLHSQEEMDRTTADQVAVMPEPAAAPPKPKRKLFNQPKVVVEPEPEPDTEPELGTDPEYNHVAEREVAEPEQFEPQENVGSHPELEPEPPKARPGRKRQGVVLGEMLDAKGIRFAEWAVWARERGLMNTGDNWPSWISIPASVAKNCLGGFDAMVEDIKPSELIP